MGEATVVCNDQEFKLQANESTYIQAGNKHQLRNETHEELVVIEVQTGSYFGEDDIVRHEDFYGRVK